MADQAQSDVVPWRLQHRCVVHHDSSAGEERAGGRPPLCQSKMVLLCCTHVSMLLGQWLRSKNSFHGSRVTLRMAGYSKKLCVDPTLSEGCLVLADVCCGSNLTAAGSLHEWMARVRLPACLQCGLTVAACTVAVLKCSVDTEAFGWCRVPSPRFEPKIEATGPPTVYVCCRWGKPCSPSHTAWRSWAWQQESWRR